jgi:SAM-dependent MidA family methyltransferase
VSELEREIAAIIAEEGPVPIDRYMALCLGHPRFGYYTTRDPFGVSGDFITAPEISQVFGELVGIWLIGAWQAMGEPGDFHLVEPGPGRGTLMADILRTARRAAPAFAAAARIALVEASPRLIEAQRRLLGDGPTWHETVASLPGEGPLLLVANEFFDALPVRQFEYRRGSWHERVVGLDDDGTLVFGLVRSDLARAGGEGDIVEIAPARQAIARELGVRLARSGGAALIIDYGHLRTAPGDTLQALKAHRPVPVLEAPGSSDLTAHVDFEALVAAFAEGGGSAHGPLTQRQFLLAMGIEQRMAALAAGADAAAAARLARQEERLAGRTAMGNLFKVLAVTAPGLAAPYPFGTT